MAEEHVEETVDIHDPDNPGQKKTIPKSDYDPAVHTLWSEPMPDDPAHTPSMPVDDTPREPVPGPAMQDPLATATPESLPDQPNAAVIEAPGSKAAELIQRQRGDEPVDLPGPRQDRAEAETRRAESMLPPGVSPKQTEEDRQLRREEMASDQGEHHELEDDEKASDKDEVAKDKDA